MSSSSNLALAELRDGPLYRFADWPNPEVPNGRIGVYTVWGGDELIYVGMGGRVVGPSADTNGPASTKLTGLRSRLASHASGRRSGDQFGNAVAARAVEREIQREGLDSGPPLLNPLPRSSKANSA
jgi:hypothetical protein